MVCDFGAMGDFEWEEGRGGVAPKRKKNTQKQTKRYPEKTTKREQAHLLRKKNKIENVRGVRYVWGRGVQPCVRGEYGEKKIVLAGKGV